MFKKGDYVTRKKYDNDIVFIVDRVENNIIYLKGVDVRLYADALSNDLVKTSIPKKKEIDVVYRNNKDSNYFYIPGIILHLDSDKNYLDKCLDYYKKDNIKVYGYLSKESVYESKIVDLIIKYKPNVIVITGHDAYYKNKKDNKYYKNSEYFINTVKKIRKEFGNDLFIFAGACQSDYKSLIMSGASYASSPKRINIHALDPAIVASIICLNDCNDIVDTNSLLSKTHYGKEGIGGIKTKGKMHTYYPRED